jgi:hypothetical protein
VRNNRSGWRQLLFRKELGHVAKLTVTAVKELRHRLDMADGEPDLLYVDLHLVHEVTSPQAFDGLRLHDRRVRRAYDGYFARRREVTQ